MCLQNQFTIANCFIDAFNSPLNAYLIDDVQIYYYNLPPVEYLSLV